MNHVARVIDPECERWAQAVRECRRRLGLKQFAFADLLGTSQSAVSRWEAGAQVPGFAMQNKVRDLLYKPLYNDRADRVLAAQVRHSLAHVSLNSDDLSLLIASPAILGDHGGEGRLRAMADTPVFQGYWRDQLELISWRTPIFGPEVVSVTGVDAWARLEEGEVVVQSYIRYQDTPVRLSSGLWVLRIERVGIPVEEGEALFGTRPEVMTLDDL